MSSCLPDNPSLDRLKVDARRLQRAARTGDTAALALFADWHPKPEVAAAQDFPLHAAQLTVARRYGFTGWPALVGYLEIAVGLSRDPGAVDEASLSPADRFCAFGCLRYDHLDEPPRWAAASALLAAHPDIVDHHLWAAAAAGDRAAVRRQLTAAPGSARRQGGPHRWEPLLYLAFSRVPGAADDAVPIARDLLDAGADPNAGYLWRGLSTPFTALTGAFGEGEQGPGRQPRHPRSIELATVLLDAGADPNDGQGLYNRMFRPDDSHLELLFSRGLGTGDGGPWRRRLREALESPGEMLRRQLDWAIDHQFTERVKLLTAKDIDVVSPSADGLTPRDRAERHQYWPVIEVLVRRRTLPGRVARLPGQELTPDLEATIQVLLAGDELDRQARLWLTANPERVERAQRMAPDVAHNPVGWVYGAIPRLGWAGFDMDYKLNGQTPLHHAARDGSERFIAMMLAAGADPTITDDEFGATPLEWALDTGQTRAAEALRPASPLPRRAGRPTVRTDIPTAEEMEAAANRTPTPEDLRHRVEDPSGTTVDSLLGTRNDEYTRHQLTESPHREWLRRDLRRHPDLIHRAADAASVARIAWAGFDVNARSEGRTALHQAAWDGDLDKIRALLDAGADPTVVDDEHGSTPLGWAEYAYQTEAAELLRRHGNGDPPAS